jgi:protein TonB
MLDQGREGHVDVTCDVDVDGSTSNCSVTNVTGGQAFADSALEYVKSARYKPRILNGVAVREPHHTFSIGFTLK